jgi:hypothetical protein
MFKLNFGLIQSQRTFRFPVTEYISLKLRFEARFARLERVRRGHEQSECGGDTSRASAAGTRAERVRRGHEQSEYSGDMSGASTAGARAVHIVDDGPCALVTWRWC